MKLDMALSESIAHAAVSHANKLGVRIAVAVCGDDGRIIAFLKMDGTNVMSGHEAMRRAMTAAGAGVPSQFAEEGKNTATSASTEGIGLSTRAGGLPFLSDGECFGGIGVYGPNSLQAVECAGAGQDRYQDNCAIRVEITRR